MAGYFTPGMGSMAQQPYNPYMAYQQTMMPPVQRYEITKVNGRPGAEAFQMAPNSNILLLDETAPIVWLAQTDGAGYKTVTPYTVTPYQPEPAVDMGQIEKRLAKVEAILSGKSDAESAGSKPRAEKSTGTK